MSKTLKYGLSQTKVARYWIGRPPQDDDFGLPIIDQFVDGVTKQGPWAFMNPVSYREHGVGRLGTGYGQRYKRQTDGRWLKVEG
jgi:hypothetical protein